MTRPQAVFFDLDQTLLQHSDPVLSHARTVLLQLAPDRPSADVAAFEAAVVRAAGSLWGRVSEWSGQGEQVLVQMFADALQQGGYESDLATRLLGGLLQLTSDSIVLTDDADRMLDGLSAAGISIGIITNGFTVFQTHKARSHGLLDRVKAIITSEDAGAHKPDRRIFELALRTLNVGPEGAWYVGDSLDKDIGGAMRAGMTSILYDPHRQYSGQQSAAISPHHVVNGLLEVSRLALRHT